MEKSTLVKTLSTLSAIVRPDNQLPPLGQDAHKACCRLSVSDLIPNPKGYVMTTFAAQYLGWWPVAVGVCVSFAAVFTALKYRIPNLVTRMIDLESKSDKHAECLNRANGLSERVDELEDEKPDKTDLATVVDSFHAVCKFNQATCQKTNAVNMLKAKGEMDAKLSDIYNIINDQKVMTARIDERVEILLNRNNANGNHG
jgi:hypothetical protein